MYVSSKVVLEPFDSKVIQYTNFINWKCSSVLDAIQSKVEKTSRFHLSLDCHQYSIAKPPDKSTVDDTLKCRNKSRPIRFAYLEFGAERSHDAEYLIAYRFYCDIWLRYVGSRELMLGTQGLPEKLYSFVLEVISRSENYESTGRKVVRCSIRTSTAFAQDRRKQKP